MGRSAYAGQAARREAVQAMMNDVGGIGAMDTW